MKKENSSDEGEIVTDAFRLAFGREPQAREVDAARKFIAQQAAITAAKAPPVSEGRAVRRRKDGLSAMAARRCLYRGRMRSGSPWRTTRRCRAATSRSRRSSPCARFSTAARCAPSSRNGTAIAATPAGRSASREKARATNRRRLSSSSLATRRSPIKTPLIAFFSGLPIELGKPYFVAVSVSLDDTSEKGITFYAKDLTNDDEPLQVVNISHKVTGGIHAEVPFAIGGLNNGQVFGRIDRRRAPLERAAARGATALHQRRGERAYRRLLEI